MKYIKYLNYLLRHKWFVAEACFKHKLYWLGITHDLSKFYPSEFIPYANHFYGGKRGINEGRDETGYYKPTDTGDDDFDFAWLLHQKRNKHHWQWWILPEDEGGLKILEIKYPYNVEMLCDWIGAGRAQKTKGVKFWYEKNKAKLQLHNNTRMVLESMMEGL